MGQASLLEPHDPFTATTRIGTIPRHRARWQAIAIANASAITNAIMSAIATTSSTVSAPRAEQVHLVLLASRKAQARPLRARTSSCPRARVSICGLRVACAKRTWAAAQKYLDAYIFWPWIAAAPPKRGTPVDPQHPLLERMRA